MATSDMDFAKLTRNEVLELAPTNKMEYFYNLQAKHRNLESIAGELMHLLQPYNEISILALIGATGVGKTMLLRRLIRQFVEQNVLDNDPSAIPFIFISAPSDGSSFVKWTTIYEDIIREGHEILKERKVFIEERDGIIKIQAHRGSKIKVFRQAVEQLLFHRKVKTLVIDEAYHLLRFGDYSVVMDTLKSLAIASDTKLVLAGSYQLFDMATNYGQVARRAEILHFARYKKDSKEDKAEFYRLTERLQEHWPCAQIPNFSAISDELMDATLGVVGLLKSLLLSALSFQLKNNEKWESEFIIKAGKSVGIVNVIRKEIEEGEIKVMQSTYGETIFTGKFLEATITKMSAK